MRLLVRLIEIMRLDIFRVKITANAFEKLTFFGETCQDICLLRVRLALEVLNIE